LELDNEVQNEFENQQIDMERVKLNVAGIRELRRLPFLDANTAKLIVQHRKQIGSIQTIAELARLTAISKAELIQYESLVDFSLPFRETRYLVQTLSMAEGRSSRVAQNYGVVEKREGHEMVMRAAVHSEESYSLKYREDLETWEAQKPPYEYRMGNSFMSGGQRSWQYVLGHYNVVFNRGLVFGSRTSTGNSAWFPAAGLSIDTFNQKIAEDESLQGVAFTYKTKDAETIFFYSVRARDLYQYEIRRRPDAWRSAFLDVCDREGKTQGDYRCDITGNWYSSAVRMESGESGKYLSLRNAYSEEIVGVNVSHSLFQHLRLGVAGYRATINMDSALGDGYFAPHSRFSANQKAYSASGVYVDFDTRSWDINLEFAKSNQQGMGVLGMVSYRRKNLGSLQLNAWRYSPDYTNPYSRAKAYSDEYLGSRQRNEEAVQAKAIWDVSEQFGLLLGAGMWRPRARLDSFRDYQTRWSSLNTRANSEFEGGLSYLINDEQTMKVSYHRTRLVTLENNDAINDESLSQSQKVNMDYRVRSLTHLLTLRLTYSASNSEHAHPESEYACGLGYQYGDGSKKNLLIRGKATNNRFSKQDLLTSFWEWGGRYTLGNLSFEARYGERYETEKKAYAYIRFKYTL